MAKKNTNSRRPTEESNVSSEQISDEHQAASEPESEAEAKTPSSKPAKSKVTEESSSSGNVGLGDIRKAVAFANSVGGLDKAIALLQIVKVAKEVQ